MLWRRGFAGCSVRLLRRHRSFLKFSARGDPLCIPTRLGLREWLHVGSVLIAHQCHCRQVVVAVMPPVIQPVMDAAPRMVPKGMRLLQHALTDFRR